MVENDDYARFTRRILAAHARRIGSGDIEGLTDLSRLPTEIDAITADAVTGLRAAGFSWAEIAARLGTSRQAAHQRYGCSRP
ncbi:helix-turn-helix domain-containing protein [Pseudonocardia sediminis]|uniref:helix-turn-helix domain-containing protein n=1 Tax=Pseudonocardia sediminis TaxID=1397368 RepID=UPI001F5FC473|nr:helix-turn-helix domain-containing protein [Pseudonocardia sediminis]